MVKSKQNMYTNNRSQLAYVAIAHKIKTVYPAQLLSYKIQNHFTVHDADFSFLVH